MSVANELAAIQIEQRILGEIVAFLKRRGEELGKMGPEHLREHGALVEAAIMIERGMWKE